MYTISKRFTFEAAHHLELMRPGHKCAQVHGHSYTVEIVLRASQLNLQGFVMDYGDFGPIRDFIDNRLDHSDLNKVLDVNPTAENIAKYLFDLFVLAFPLLVAVRVSETDNTWAEYADDSQ